MQLQVGRTLCLLLLLSALCLCVAAQSVDGGQPSLVEQFGSYGIPGCPYFSPAQSGPTPGLTPYDAQSAEDKLAYVWSLLLRNQTSALTVPLSTGLIFTESMQPTVHFQSDFMPAGRQKAVHGDGVVCRVKLHIERDNPNNAYTGLLQSGSDTAVLRLSSVLDPSLVHGPVPSIAIKFFKDGELSANFVALNSEAPQVAAAAAASRPRRLVPLRAQPVYRLVASLSQLETSNPFARPLTNQFVALPQDIITKFQTVSIYPNFTGTSALAYHSLQSDKQTINFPWQLIFVPNPEVQTQLPEHFGYATVDLPGQQSFHLGHLRALSAFHRSEFGDLKLFFKHGIEEEDVQLRPEFGRLCPLQSPSCSPCPQTYDCTCDHWRQQIGDNVYSSYYEPHTRAQYAEVSPYVQAAFGSPQHPGPGRSL